MRQLSRNTPSLLKTVRGKSREERAAKPQKRSNAKDSDRDELDLSGPDPVEYRKPKFTRLDSDDESAAETEKINSASIKRSSFKPKSKPGAAEKQERVPNASKAQGTKNGAKRKLGSMGNREDEDLDRLVKPKKSLKGYGSKAREAEERELEREERQRRLLKKGPKKKKAPPPTFQSLPDDVSDVSPPPTPEKRPNFESIAGDKTASASKAKTLFKCLSESDCSPPPASRSKNPSIASQRGKKRRQDEESQGRPPPTFKMPSDLCDDGITNDEVASIKSSPTPEPARFQDDFFASSDEDGDGAATGKSLSAQKSATCPWCGETVDADLLKSFAKGKRLNVRQQTQFCQKHKTQTDRDVWKSRGYPSIDWVDLPARISIHFDELEDIINGQPSYYRTQLAEKIEAGKARNMNHEGNLTPGYYGPKGGNIMSAQLMKRFDRLLKRNAVEDVVISGRGPAAFVQGVLVAELAVRLIMHDLDITQEKAREVLEESKTLGERLHEEN